MGGFGTAGNPKELIDGPTAQGTKDLTVVNNNVPGLLCFYWLVALALPAPQACFGEK